LRVTAAVVAAAVYLSRSTTAGDDFGFPVRAARALIRNCDPYAVTPPFLYPLPAAVVALPLAWLPIVWASAVAVALSAALLPVPILLSAPFVLGVLYANPWAAFVVGGMGWVAAVKPNIGGVGIITNTRRRDIVIAAALLALSFLLMPSWPIHWWAALHRQIAPHWPPVAWPLGAIGLLGALRWRQPQGRALVAATLLPSSALPYDLLVLWLCARAPRDAWVLTGCSWLTWLAITATAPHDLVRPWTVGHLLISLGVIAPATVIVLRLPRSSNKSRPPQGVPPST
jgi:hypothetical protein